MAVLSILLTDAARRCVMYTQVKIDAVTSYVMHRDHVSP